SVITQWLQYPKEQTISAAQAKFVITLTEITESYDVLLLDATWKAYCYPKSELFKDRKIKHITDKHMLEDLTGTVQDFLQFLHMTIPMPQSLVPHSTDNSLMKKIKEYPDFYMPFRELAPSQLQATNPQGPFEHNYIRTRSGVFSALIYRGITYTAPAECD
ncbi:hypothetical protein K439DRAFT_1299465, partial [Ramaria rubella]